MKRPHSELRLAGDCAHAEFVLGQMEAIARSGTDGAARNIGGKWLSVFVNGGKLTYNWQGGYPTNIISRAAALSVLARA